MKFLSQKLIRNFDWISFIAILIIASFGLIMLYSIALGSGDAVDMLNFKKQIFFVLLGIILYLVMALFVDYRVLYKYSSIFYGLGIIILLGVLVFGRSIRGTTGWFIIGPFSVQPVEFVKIILIIFLARHLTFKAKYIVLARHLIASLAGVGVLIALVLLQPDFGSAVLLFSIWLGLVILTGIKKRHIALMVTVLAVLVAVLWLFIFQDYQKNRVMVFINPSLDPLGKGYNITQAIIAVGSGQVFGRGLSFGSQSKLKFLPESQTDFIFAVVAEQLGFLGVIIVVGLFGLLLWRIIAISRQSHDNFAIYLCLGAVIILFSQIFINLGMNVGLLPVTGLPLPLISYGGSSLISTLVLLGIVQSVSVHRS